MCYAYKKAGNLTREVNEMIEKVLKKIVKYARKMFAQSQNFQ